MKFDTDIFDLNEQKYLTTVDYYSRYTVIRHLNDMTASNI